MHPDLYISSSRKSLPRFNTYKILIPFLISSISFDHQSNIRIKPKKR